MSCVNREVRWAWALIPFPILYPPLISHKVYQWKKNTMKEKAEEATVLS